MYKFYPESFVRPPKRGRTHQILLAMKLTALLLTIGILHVSAASYAQKVTLKDQNASLKEVFNQIRQQSGYDFIITGDLLSQAKPVTVNLNNLELKDALDIVFSNEPLAYTIEEKTVVVFKKQKINADKANGQSSANALPVTVTGKVVDGTGQSIPGVNVREKGKQNGTVTDSKGKYSLSVTDDKSVVTFSYIGYETQELAAKDIPDGSAIVLKAAENNLQEVVISKGYYDEKRELSTGDVSVVTAKTISEQPVSDPIQALIGRVAGLNIQQTSGVPGAYATIHINGLNSIANGNDPLYVIDGVPFSSTSLSSISTGGGAVGTPTPTSTGANYNNNGQGLSPFNALNPSDIESIEVLKDADATAIYGSRVSNGVILITTKKGKAGDTKFALDASQGVGSVSHFMDLLNTQQYLQERQQAFANDGKPFPSITTNPSDNNYDVDGVWDTTRYTNWQKEFIGGTAQWTNIQGSLSGGNANTQFLIGGGYNRQTTVYPGDFEDKKGSFHASITHTSTNQKFHAAFTASYVNENNNIPTLDLTQDITLAPDAPALYNHNGGINWQPYDGNTTFNNPIARLLQSQISVTNNLVSSLNLSYQLLPGLVLSSNFGYTHDEMNETELQPDAAVAPPYNTDPNNRSYNFANTVNETWIIEPKLSYEKKIAKATFNILVGGTFEQDRNTSLTQYAEGYASDALIIDPLAATSTGLLGDNYTLYRYNAIYGRIGYNWDGKYLLNFTARRDGSSRFGPDKQFGNFGAIGAGWIFTKEKFVEDNIPWLSFGKLRGSYGVTGNDQIADYGYLSSYNVNSTTYQGITQLVPNGLPNANFSWETDKKLEAGLDLGFLKDRINLSVNYYRERSSNQLVGYPLPDVSGYNSYQYNLPATVQNTSFQATLNTVNIKQKNFIWNTSLSFTLPENKLVSYPGLAGSDYSNTYVIGQSLYSEKVYQYIGVNAQAGLYTFATQNSNGIPTQQERVNVLPTQKFYGGMQNSFNYKDFSLDVFLQFVKQTGRSYQSSFLPPGDENENEPTAVLGAWQTPGQIANTQKYTTDNFRTYILYRESTGDFTDASFIRIKNVALSYKMPATWQQWAGMQNAKIFIEGQNLYTFTKYIGLDPETQGLTLPPLRMITVGLSASF